MDGASVSFLFFILFLLAGLTFTVFSDPYIRREHRNASADYRSVRFPGRPELLGIRADNRAYKTTGKKAGGHLRICRPPGNHRADLSHHRAENAENAEKAVLARLGAGGDQRGGTHDRPVFQYLFHDHRA